MQSEFFRSVRSLLKLVLAAMFVTSGFANLPGGSDGTGANVTLSQDLFGNLTLANGVVTTKLYIPRAQVLEFTYNGVQVTDGGADSNNGFYWQGNSGSQDKLEIVVDPATNGGNFAIVRMIDSYTNNSANADSYRYFALFRGSPGLYVSEVMVHTAAMPAGGVDFPSLTCKLGGGIFNWLAQDTGRNKLMQSTSDSQIAGINFSPKEVSLLSSGQLAGQFDCKYDFSGDLGSLGVSGWCSTNRTTNFGLWCIHPSNEYFSCGPTHREILAQMMLINTTFKGVHYGFHDDLSMDVGENWAKVAGPFFLYFNKVASGTANPQAALYSDALAQTAAERGAWPYSWFSDSNFVKANGRGTVAGKMLIADVGNPNASVSNLWVGLAQQPILPSTLDTDFQLWGKNYQYWTKSDANGNFVFTNVIAGSNYTLFAFGPGAIGQFQSQPLSGNATPVTVNIPASPFSVTVNSGATNILGNVTWTPTRVGATVWELGVPDRDATEFRHGNDYWHGDMGNATNYAVNWAPFQNFSFDFPNGVNYTVGQSHWDKDWSYAQATVLNPATGDLNASGNWTISFALPSGPTNGAAASIYFGIASSYSGPVIVQVNGNNIAGSTGFFPAYSSSTTANDAMIRMSSHGIFSDYRINFSSSLLHAGTNTVTLNMRKGGYFANSTLYDYIRLELAGYVPPTPTTLSASAGNGLVSLFWPTVPGATSYNLLRSTTSGSGFAIVATNILGPVCGSVDDVAVFTDTDVVSGTTYYYVVRSTNPTGSSTNSVQVSATPSAAMPAAPSTPTGLAATAGNNVVTLKWNASSGAARYIVRRTVLTIGAVTTYTPGGINPYDTINSFVTGTNYTDTALANNVIYSYTVSAANANGQSADSAAVSAFPRSPVPSTPTGLSASVISNQVTVSWSVVSGATSYSVQRAAALAGPYTTVDSPEPLTAFVDSGLSYNTTCFYRVASASLGGISSNSTPVSITTTPPPPAPITAIPGNTQVFIDWGDSAGSTNYVLQRSVINGGPYTTIVSTTNTSYLDAAVNNGTTYFYVAYAVGTNGQSPLSAQTTATPSAIPQMIKSDTTNMDVAADWSGVTPVINEVGIFNNIISAANEAALTLGGDVSLGGLVFSNNLNGPVSVGAGNTLTLGDSGIDMSRANQNVTFNNDIALAALQVWNVTNGRTLSVNGAFTSSSNMVIKVGGGILSLGVTSSDAGANIQVNAGTVQANASSGIRLSLNGGTFNVNAADSNPITVMSGGVEQNVGGNRTWSGSLSGSGPLTVVASSTHTWNGNNSAYTGTITLQGSGTLRLSSLSSVSAGTAYNFNSGTMSANASGIFNLGSLSGFGSIFTGSGQNFSFGALGSSTVFSGVIVGGGYIIKTGAGTLTLAGANSYTGGTIVSNGVLQIGNGGTAGAMGSGNVTNRGTLAFNRSDAIDDGGFGTISGTGVLDKLGSGRLILTKAHAYSGATLIEAGTLALTNSGAIASSSSINISAGAQLDLSGVIGGSMSLSSGKIISGNGSVNGGFIVGSGAMLSPGINGIGQLTFSNSLTLSDGSTNVFEISRSPLTNDSVRVLGMLTNGGTLIVTNIDGSSLMAGDSFRLFDATSYSGSFAALTLPTLDNGLLWNINAINTNGILNVVSAPPPVIASYAVLNNGTFRLNFSGVSGQIYEIRASTDLTVTPFENWTLLGTGTFNGNAVVFDDPQATNFPQRFYVIRLP